MANVSKTYGKPCFWSQTIVLPPRQKSPRPHRRTALLGPAKPSLFHCLKCMGQQNYLFRNARRLVVLICWNLVIFEAPGASCRSLLLMCGDQIPQKCNVVSYLAGGSFKSCMFSHAKIHQTPLTSKSKERTPENRRTSRSNLDVQDLPESSVYTVLPISKTIPTAAVWA